MGGRLATAWWIAVLTIYSASLLSSAVEARAAEQKSQENLSSPNAETPVIEPGDYWVYVRPDGTKFKTRADSSLKNISFPLSVGKSWSYETQSRWRYSRQFTNRAALRINNYCEVVSYKPVAVIGQNLDAFECRCHCEVVGEMDGYTCGAWTLWYAPAAKNIVRLDGESTTISYKLLEYKFSKTPLEPAALDPKTAYDFTDRGNAYFDWRDYDKAIDDYSRAVELDPSYASAFFNRARALKSLRDDDAAIADYTRAIQVNRQYSAAFNNRGIIYAGKKEYERAIKDFDEAIRIKPNYALALNNRAGAYREMQKYERALSDYQAAAQMEPKLAQHKRMGYTFFFLGKIPNSAEAMNKAVKAAPQDIYAVIWRYLTSAKTGDSQVAIRELGENAANIKETHWPSPVMNFYLNKIDEKAMYAAAESADAKKNTEQICEANFYAAEGKFLNGRADDAIPLLRMAEKDCPPTFNEAHAARAELKRLGRP